MTIHDQINSQYSNFTITQHAQTSRLYDIKISKEAIINFFNIIQKHNITVDRLIYTPYERLIVADYLDQIIGDGFCSVLKTIINDRASGGFVLSIEGVSQETDDYVIFSTAIAHLLGHSNHDAMSGKYYARFTVKDKDTSDSYLRQAYRLFTLHTDGTFVADQTDWLLMMKMAEEYAVGGESRLLHLDDWVDLEKYSTNPLGRRVFRYIAPESKKVSEVTDRRTFFTVNNRPCICFIDQFVYPETIEEAKYLKSLSHSMETDKHVVELTLPTGSLVVINNTFWLHGRAAFEKNEKLNRELLRQRGRFVETSI